MNIRERIAAAEAKVDIAKLKKQATAPFRVDIANGTYTCKPVKAEVAETSTGKLVWRTSWLVVDGSEGDGKTLPKSQFMSDEQGLERALRDCAALGYDVGDDSFSLSDSLEEICEELVEKEPEVKIRVSTAKDKEDPTKEYQNFDIKSTTWPEDDDEPEVAPAPAKPVAPAKPAAPAAKAPEPVAPAGRRRGRPTAVEAQAKIAAAAAPDEEEDEPGPPTAEVEEEEDPEIGQGSIVEFTFKGEKVQGTVLEFLEEDTLMRVDLGAGRVVKGKVENITGVIKS